jgi:hypothetical protein
MMITFLSSQCKKSGFVRFFIGRFFKGTAEFQIGYQKFMYVPLILAGAKLEIRAA